MNWKVNYWTLLFVLASLAIFVLVTKNASNPIIAANMGPEPQTLAAAPCTPDTLMADTAKAYINKYLTVWLPQIPSGKDYGVDNSQIQSFKLDHCELREMLAFDSTGAEVFANLAIKDGLIDLIFSVHRVTAISEQVEFFDFTIPCPPTCY